MKKFLLAAACLTAATLGAGEYTAGSVSERINIDGQLAEDAWSAADEIKIVEGENRATTKIVWDENYLYLGITVFDYDIRGRWGMKNTDVQPDHLSPLFNRKAEEITDAREIIPIVDATAGITLELENGQKVILKVNPLNNTFTSWTNAPWNCPGLLTAVRIDGTLNYPGDVDRCWTLEMAIPWKSLAQVLKTKLPPQDKTEWNVTLERSYFTGERGKLEFIKQPVKLTFKKNQTKFTRLFAWMGMSKEEIARQAKALGVTDAAMSPGNKEQFAFAKKYGITTYATYTPIGVGKRMQNPGAPSMNLKEIFSAAKVEDKSMAAIHRSYFRNLFATRFGGEVEDANSYGDVLLSRIACLTGDDAMEAAKERIKKLCEMDNVDGIAFDFIGYENFNDCKCEVCEQACLAYLTAEKLPDTLKNRQEFFLKQLVDYNNKLAAYIRELRPEFKIMAHIYPNFEPEPLYGNRLDVDFCAQTASWYFLWPQNKIAKYAETIKKDEAKYFKNAKGVSFMGYYDSSKLLDFPYKSPERIALELRIMLKYGCNMLSVCGFNDVINNPEAANVFRRYIEPGK